MKSDTMQVLILAGVMLAAIILGVISWSMIPDSGKGNVDSASPQDETDDVSQTDSQPTPAASTPAPTASEPSYMDNDPGYEDNGQLFEGLAPSSIVKWNDHKLGSELTSDGTAVWTELIESTVSARIGYNRLAWDNVFYDNQLGGGNTKLQVTLAFTDGNGWDSQRNRDGIGYHGTWAPTTMTWVVTSGTWNPRWTLGVTHWYTPDFSQGPDTGTYGLHYKTYE
jgi:hypothetical protein